MQPQGAGGLRAPDASESIQFELAKFNRTLYFLNTCIKFGWASGGSQLS
jgi:hypothetical protein